jgi:hypothetical protein
LPFRPETPEEIFAQINGRFVANAEINDVNEGSVVVSDIGAVAGRIARVEQRIQALYKSFYLDAEGQDLIDRVLQLPGFQLLGESPAQGACLQLRRDSSDGELVVQAGSIYADKRGNLFQQKLDVTFLDGYLTYPAPGQPYVYVVSVVPGLSGNVGTNTITVVRSSAAGVISCSNVLPLTNGLPRETDEQIRQRGLLYHASLAGVQKAALLYQFKSYQSPVDGSRFPHVAVWEDPVRPYAEVNVDDGSGYAGLVSPGTTITGIVPENGQLDFWTENPVREDDITLKVNGVAVEKAWDFVPERGQGYLTTSAAFWTAGDTWSIEGYHIYGGIVREGQALVEGRATTPGTNLGFRANGVRVRVRPAQTTEIPFDLLVVAASGYEPLTVYDDVRSAVVAFVFGLEIGEPLLIFDLSAYIKRLPQVKNFKARNAGDTTLAMTDRYPASRHRLTTSPPLIKVNGTSGV